MDSVQQKVLEERSLVLQLLNALETGADASSTEQKLQVTESQGRVW